MAEHMSFIKSGFCREEVKCIDQLIVNGFGKSRADIIRKATLEYISNFGGA